MRHCQRLTVNALTVKNDDDHGREIDHDGTEKPVAEWV
ncbi:hypothetical protein EDF88_3548 [Buttiauxella sp. BIGb0552]|nr:hypothetical protein EDF88_3548 [Buttiauxella sp. BIGb0552]